MKKQLLKISVLAFIAFIFTGCEKDGVGDEFSISASEEVASGETLLNDADDEAAFKMENPGIGSGGCPTVTSLQPFGTYPNTITIDFGTAGCPGRNGRIKKGQIVVEVTDDIRNEGAVRTITLHDFYVDDNKVEGIRILTNWGPNDEGLTFFTCEVNDGRITQPDGKWMEWSAQWVKTLIEGGATPEISDDVFSVTGGGSGQNSEGKTITSSVVNPLTKPRNCSWVVSGILQITVDGDRTRTLDFGTGVCDNSAVVHLPGGQTRTIQLRR